MAEVRKKVIEDKYNTSSIKIKTKEKNAEKISNKKSGKKTNEKRNSTKSEKKQNLFVRFRIFCNGVKSEFKKVHWTNKKDMLKYSIATIFFVIFCSGFFYLINVLFALIQSLFN